MFLHLESMYLIEERESIMAKRPPRKRRKDSRGIETSTVTGKANQSISILLDSVHDMDHSLFFSDLSVKPAC